MAVVMRFIFLFFFSVFLFLSSFADAACYEAANTFSCFVDKLNCSISVTNSQFATLGPVSGSASCTASGHNLSYDYNVTVTYQSGSGNYYAAGATCSFSSNDSYNFNNFTLRYCSTKCEADSLVCLQDPEATWDSQNCKCGAPTGPPPDSTFVCQNAGGPEPGGFGGPRVAKLFKCDENQVCTNTADLAGTCQDWGFCPEGVDHCYVPPDSTGNPPCGRSGSGMTSTTSCYYACADGKNLQCKPVSTQYVAGSIYVGECPSSPPAGCYPTSSSSGGGGSSSSGGGSSSSSYGYYSSSDGFVPPDTVVIPQGSQIDYTRILNAIKDTLHRANNQRDFIANLQVTANQSFDRIASYSQYGYSELNGINQKMSDVVTATSSTSAAADGINSTLTSLQDNGIKITGPVASAVENSNELLDEINRYLRSDSLLVNVNPLYDTTYNPLLRGIKDAIEEGNAYDSTVADRIAAKIKDTSFVTSGSLLQNALNSIVSSLSPDTSRTRSCGLLNACLRTGKGFAACYDETGISLDQCTEGGTPFDGIWNTEVNILETLAKAFFGDVSFVDSSVVDTSVEFPPSLDSARSSLADALRSVLSSDSTASILQRVKEMKDSAEARKNDTTKIQPDSLVLDSSQAAKYAEHVLLNAPTVNECFVCHADLGNFGGLTDTTLKIHIDFANFGGFNWCELIRSVIRIMTLVVCISLQLGSWAAAFGYNPKNDA